MQCGEIINVEQGTPEWLSLRCGIVTASRIADLTAKTKSGPSASRANYMAELIAERLTGAPYARFQSAAMLHGTETEPQARAAYEFITDAEVEQVGFILHPAITGAGCSPDGLVGAEGMVEIKCPQTATHLATVETGKVDGKYVKQMQFQMACAGRAWCDFVSFDPALPAHLQLFRQRVPRDAAMIGEIESEVVKFLAEMNTRIERLSERAA